MRTPVMRKTALGCIDNPTPRMLQHERQRYALCMNGLREIDRIAKRFADAVKDADVEGYRQLLLTLTGLEKGKIIYSRQPEHLHKLVAVLDIDGLDDLNWVDELIELPPGNARILFVRRKFHVEVQPASWIRKMVEHLFRD